VDGLQNPNIISVILNNMQFVDINQKIWKELLQSNRPSTFLQSLGWGEFNKLMNNPVYYKGIKDMQGNIISTALVVKIKARRASFLLVPHGPLFYTQENYYDLDLNRFWLQNLTLLARQEKCSFIRFQPIIADSIRSTELFQNLGLKPAPIHMHTEHTVVLDLQQTEAEILMGMRKTTRQMIKKGLKLIDSKELFVDYPNRISKEMWDVYESTGRRGQFFIYSQDYLKNEWEVFRNQEKSQLVIIRTKDQLLSWGMVIVSNGRAYYHQGANILDKRYPNSYLCQWYCIQYAMANKALSYDFWGVAAVDKPKHPWANISVFKRGFGGKDVVHAKAQDLILRPSYWLSWLLETFRSYKRGFRS
jgi:lipid II:glycine glycyltransferase (peptidoglycan interpeptide bridge formation enzyme)